jgi:periplasmic protein TonB
MKFFIVILILIACVSNVLIAQTTNMSSDTIPAQYKGGVKELCSFIGKNFKYPQNAINANVSGGIIARFKIKANAEIDSIQIIKSPGFGVDIEAIRVIKLMNQWIPSKVNEKYVDIFFTLPINICTMD